MITITRDFVIDNKITSNDDELNIKISNRYIKKNNNKDINNKESKVKNNDIIKVLLNIRNISNNDISKLKLTIIDDSSFKFIHSSIRDNKTKAFLFPMSNESNTFELETIHRNSAISLSYFMQYKNSDIVLKRLNSRVNIANCNKFMSNSQNNTLVLPLIPVLKVNILDSQSQIRIENIGTDESKNVVYKYDIPKGYAVDISSIKYEFYNEKVSIKANKIGNNIVFYIDKIPVSTELDRKILTILLKHRKVKPALGSVQMTLN